MKIQKSDGMINHVVLFKLKDFPAEEKAKIRTELKSLLEGLKSKIKEVKYLEVGVHFEQNAKNYDLALISHFENLDDLEKYRVHPEHQKVVARFAEVAAERAAVDFEF